MTISPTELSTEQLDERVNAIARRLDIDDLKGFSSERRRPDELVALFRAARLLLTRPSCTIQLTIGEELSVFRALGWDSTFTGMRELAVGIHENPWVAVARVVVALEDVKHGA